MSKKTKEKVKLFEKAIIQDAKTAKELYEKEEKQFKFRLICVGVAFVTTVTMLLGMKGWLDFMPDVIAIVIIVAGLAATIISGPINIVKLFLKVGKVCYFIMPIPILDLAMFAIGLCFALIVLLVAPVVFAACNLYQSYINKKEAEKILAVAGNVSEESYEIK